MADSPGQRLAGIFGPRFRAAMAVPQEDMATKLARALGAFGTPSTAPAGDPDNIGQTMTPQAVSVAPNPAIDPDRIGQTMTPQAVAVPAAQALPSPTAATQPQLAGSNPGSLPSTGAIPPMPAPTTVRDDVLKAAQQMLAQNLLPEQWKGAFTNSQGFPR